MNAARIYHFDNMTSIGMWFPHCERKSHHSKKHVFGGLNWGTGMCFSPCQRDVTSCPFASISGMFFLHVECAFPIDNAMLRHIHSHPYPACFFTCGMCFSHCQRDVTSYPFASTSGMIFMYVECACPIVNANVRRDASYWQRDMKSYPAPLLIIIPYARQCISASRISA